MSKFKYSKEELNLNKIIKLNQDISHQMQNDTELITSRAIADSNIGESLKLLRSLGKEKNIESLSVKISSNNNSRKLHHRPKVEAWDEIVQQANDIIPERVNLEDIMSSREINEAFSEKDEINRKFSQKTSLINRTDLSFLAIATALQVSKSLIFPYIAEKFDYGDSFDKTERMKHNDPRIEKSQRQANDRFRDKHKEKHETGRWINLLYQTPAYDITKGSSKLGINMGGASHRMYTLGHDPILGWIFGTMNILTDTITMNNFQSFRVTRNPMLITGERVSLGRMFNESYNWIKDDHLNLPAALFAQYQHLKSDEFTKMGLPVPIISSFNEEFASKLYKNNYDALCFARDLKMVGSSFIVSSIFDLIISLVHGLFRKENEPIDIFEVKTRKILLISNAIASTSTIINTSVTANPKNLDVGSLLNTTTRLFRDTIFITRIKKEFIESEISTRIQKEIDEIDRLFEEI